MLYECNLEIYYKKLNNNFFSTFKANNLIYSLKNN